MASRVSGGNRGGATPTRIATKKDNLARGRGRPKNTPNDDEIKNVCPICEGNVNHGNKALQCEICTYWYHIDCENISKALYSTIIEEDADHQFSWYCRGCRRGQKTLMEAIKAISSQHDELKADVADISKHQAATDTKVSRIESDMKKLKAEGVGNGSSASEVIREMKRRQQGAAGIVIHNLPESVDDDAKNRVAHDTDKLKEICINSLDLADTPEIEGKIFRAGPKNDKGPRPLKVRFKEKNAAMAVLKTYNSLNPQEKRNKGIQFSISRELTKTQREEGQELRKIQAERQADLDAKKITDVKWKVDFEQGKVVKIKVVPQ